MPNEIQISRLDVRCVYDGDIIYEDLEVVMEPNIIIEGGTGNDTK